MSHGRSGGTPSARVKRAVVAACSAVCLLACRDAAPPAAPARGDFAGPVEIAGGRRIYLECRGEGSPLVVLEAGLRNRGDIWSVPENDGDDRETVFPGVARFTRVCAYDRPGTTLGSDQRSRSDPVPMPRSAADAVGDLHALLRAAGLPPPYVLVGHSTGGLIVRLYASTYPDEVVGMVLVDAISEAMQRLLTPEQFAIYDQKVLVDAPPELASYGDLEIIDFPASFAQMRQRATATPLRPMPLVVLSKDERFPLPPGLPDGFADLVEAAWTEEQRELAMLVPDARHVVDTHSGHYIQVEQPQLVRAAIVDVVEAARAARQE